MSHVVYNKATFRTLKGRHGQSYFANERAAKAALTRKVNGSSTMKRDDWIVMESQAFYKLEEPMVDTYNILDPDKKPFKIRISLKGTRQDPATEGYHTL